MIDFTQQLTPEARKLMGLEQKEVNVVVKKDVVIGDEVPEAAKAVQAPAALRSAGFDMQVDSPKALWDAVGHVSFKFSVAGYEEAMEKIGELTGVWAAIKEDFADLFVQADLVSDKQVVLLKRLLGKDFTDSLLELSKSEASIKIQELMDAKDKGTSPEPSSSSRFTRPASKPARDGGAKTTGREASEAQLKYARIISDKSNVALPDDYLMWSSGEASAWIAANK